MSQEIKQVILQEVWGLNLGPRTEYNADRTRRQGTQNLIGFEMGTLAHKADRRGTPQGPGVEVKNDRIMKKWNESDDQFSDRVHLKLQEPIAKNTVDDFNYIPHSDSIEEYLKDRPGKAFASTIHRDKKTGETTHYSHHIYPIYRN